MDIIEKINLDVLTDKKQKAPQKGDIFVLKPKGHDYYWGIVVKTDTKFGSTNTLIHIQIFSLHSKGIDEIPNLSNEKLLIPPIITNKLAWKKGYFLTVSNTNVDNFESAKNASFYNSIKKVFYNDNQEKINPQKKLELIGQHLLISYLEIDNRISYTLKIPLAEDYKKGKYDPYWYLEVV